MPALRLLVADDHELVRRGLCVLLRGQPGWEIVAEARDGREAVKMAKECKPDVAVLDIAMPNLNGLEAARQINKAVPSTKVLILTMHESDSFIKEAIEAGVRGFVLKTDASKDLVAAVDALGHRRTFFNSEVEKVIFDGLLPPCTPSLDPGKVRRSRLTSRQCEIVQLLAEGKSTKEVATVLCLSVKTVETHRTNIMNRLDCHSVTALVRYALRNHIAEL